MVKLSKVLIANRGEIAVRVVRACKDAGIGSVAVYADPDRDALYVRLADEAHSLGGATPADSYLDIAKIVKVAVDTGADSVHPGYGFLAENAEFAARCEAAGIAFIGPTPDQIRAFGLKHTARELATKAGLPLLPGTDLLKSIATARRAAKRIGYPVMLKSRRRRRHRHAPVQRRQGAGRGVRRRHAPGREPLQAGGQLPGEVRRPRAPRRGADVRRRARARAVARRRERA